VRLTFDPASLLRRIGVDTNLLAGYFVAEGQMPVRPRKRQHRLPAI